LAKTANSIDSSVLRVTLSTDSVRLLEDLAFRGIYGRNPAEVASRFVDEALQRFVEAPKLKLRTPPKK
jgi:hypothetical protein